MKRDMDLVRQILLKIETSDDELGLNDLIEPKATNQDVVALAYNLGLIVDEGFVTGVEAHTLVEKNWFSLQLTWRGHEFLDTLRDPTVWSKTKEVAAKAGGASLQVFMEIGKAVIVETAKGLIAKGLS